MEHTYTLLPAQEDPKHISRPFVANTVFRFLGKVEHPPNHTQKDREIDVRTQERQEHTL